MIAPVFVSNPSMQLIHIHISIFTQEGAQIVNTFVLMDCSTIGSFINRDLVQKKKIPMIHLLKPLQAQNIDRSANSGGIIQHKVLTFVQIRDAEERRDFLIINCGKENMILGLPWLCEANPTINWKTREVHILSLPKNPHHDSPKAIT